MNAYELLELFHHHAVGLEVADGKLRLTAPKGFLTPDRLAALKRNKQQLIAILSGDAQPGAGRLNRRPPSDAPLPLSSSQRQLWYLDQLSPGNPFYNNPSAFEITGELDLTALRRAVSEVVRRHESLRTVFPLVDGEPCQQVLPAGPAPMTLTDLTGLPAPERLERARQITEADARAPFDLATGPLLRTSLLKLGPQQYRWLLNVHHIVADGWSIGILVHEVGQLYGAYLQDRPSPLPELAVQYPDYALWQREREPGDALEYWASRLADAPTLLALPTDRPRPAAQRFQGGRLYVTADAGTLRGLHALSRAGEATLFMTLMASLSVLLWRYSGQDDVCVGTPFANRDSSELEQLIGHFINTVVIRSQLAPGQPFSELLGQVRHRVLEAYAHADQPFEQLVQALRPERHASYSPLFQVMLVLQNMPLGEQELPGLALRPLETSTGAARFDLALEVTERGGELELLFEYDSDLFEPATIARMAAHFVRLLKQVSRDPHRPIGELELLSAAERQHELYGYNAAPHAAALSVAAPDALAGPAGLVERFEVQASRFPAQLAVVSRGQSLDYATLDRRANRLAAALIGRGVGPDQLVGLCMQRSVELVVGILGILKAGAGYLPLDPALPAERLAGMVADAQPALVLTDSAPTDSAPTDSALTDSALTDSAPVGGTPLAALEAEGGREDRPGVAVHPANLAYVIYTSGSTGRPKGVAVSHASVTTLLDHWLARLGPAPGAAAALWSSIGFDVSVQEILLPLTSGGALHLAPEEVRVDPEALMAWLREHRIEQAYLPPAYVTWIDEAPAERLSGLALRQLLVGVEPLPELALHRMCQELPGLRVLNGYGPTETAVYSSAYLDPRPLARQCPIGRPLDNTRIYLLDERLRPVPIGVAAEIYIGGAGVARGYLGRPGQTAERFVPDPFVPGERMYRTGDLGRRLPDGDLCYAGRRDHQVKLRGFRVELGEVEAVLREQPGVREAAVLLDESGAEPRLVAAVARGEASAQQPAEWREALSRQLPGYMIPAVFLELAELPRTANGKLDRAALLRQGLADAPMQVNQASPRDHVELTLYKIWERLLLQPDIGISDSFFDVGGSSISAIKLAHAINEAFGQRLPISEIVAHPSIEALAARLRRGAGGPPGNLIEFRPGDAEPGQAHRRVVCVHPAGGTAFCYLSLAKALPAAFGVYGIQSPGVNPGEAFLPTVEAMAEAYLRLIEPMLDGPLVLTGLSYGGLVAYEMGRRLALAGNTRVSVLLLDTQGTDDPAERAEIEPVELPEFRDKLIKFNGMYPGIEDSQIEQYFRVYNHNRLSMRDYLTPPSPARLVLLQAVANRDEASVRQALEFWQRRAGQGLAVEVVDCDHWEILETDEVRGVAALIGRELDCLSRPDEVGSASVGSDSVRPDSVGLSETAGLSESVGLSESAGLSETAGLSESVRHGS
ncbi:MAG TPA: amino acid adenylation domain-containing protein [Jatrophihabitans sp.]|jgi:amino acid adenylation domain-containing protein|uniref:non-ribosomal peptide synthetase n=1 Tax=Jatrophihabitans sp. TaxID=1932789 RepID=UPI002EF510D6